MIIGLVGPSQQDIQLIVDLLTEDKSIQFVDGLEVIRAMDRKHISSIISTDYHKKYMLKELESELGTYIITGNLLLSQNICEWIRQNCGIIIVVSRAKAELYDNDALNVSGGYWDDPYTQKYELETKYKELYDNLLHSKPLSDDLYLIDITDEDSDELTELVEHSQEWKNSKIFGLKIQDLVALTTRKEDNHMTMEDSIKKAMQELGISLDDEPVQEIEKPKTTEKKQKSKTTVHKKPEPKPEPEDEYEDVTTAEFTDECEKDSHQEENEPEESNSIFIKLTDTTMALLLPTDIHLEKQSIGGMNFNVATVSIPDWNSRKLQELELARIDNPKQVKPTVENPKTVEKPEKSKTVEKPLNTETTTGDLEDYQKEKARLDAEIKKYRAEGNLDMVNALRKQRRVVRGKINQLKK